jgi:hypothetical protein
MPEASRHAKPKKTGMRFGAPIVAAATLAGVAVAFVFLHGGTAAPGASRDAIQATSATTRDSGITNYQVTTALHRYVATLETRMARRARTAARRRHLAALAATRRVQQQAAAQPSASPSPNQSSAPAPPPSSAGGNAAASPLGICIRNAEEGGSYAWGPGNGGGAYQFLLSTWEAYGGAASQYGVAGPAYQDQIFNNAIAAGAASQWTNYDGC